jgi:hypothetical protein
LIPPWPVWTIDFEASSLEHDGYPIEVGLACWPERDEPVSGWSTLIHPVWDWSSNGHWSTVSAKVHGIRGRDLVERGREPALVAGALNTAIGSGSIGWCDGGPYDAHWMRALFKAAGLTPVFTLGDWHQLTAMLGRDVQQRTFEWIERSPPRHRARADAEKMLLALAHGIGVEPGPPQDLADRVPALAALTGLRTGE